MPTFLKRMLVAGVIGVLFVVLNKYMSDEGLLGFGMPPYIARLLMLVGISVILAVSLNLVNGFTGQFSIGHAGFMAIGAYSAAYLIVYHAQFWEQKLATMVGGSIAHALIFLLAILFGALAAALAGLLVGIPSLRLRGDYLAIVTLGFAEIIRIVIVNIDKVGGATGFSVPTYTNFIWVGAFAFISVVVVYNIVNSDIGRALISIREDELAAQAMGVNTTRYKVLAFVISSAFPGIAGVLFGHYSAFLSTNDFTFIRSFEIIIMIVLGGMGSITGSILGAVVITILPELLRQLPKFIIWLLSLVGVSESSMPDLLHRFLVDLPNWRLVIYAALLILVMLFRPQGILGQREFGFNWLKRAQKRPEGDEAVGASSGVPIAERSADAETIKKVENR